MEAIPEGFVSIQIHMPPEVLADLRSRWPAAPVCRSRTG